MFGALQRDPDEAIRLATIAHSHGRRICGNGIPRFAPSRDCPGQEFLTPPHVPDGKNPYAIRLAVGARRLGLAGRPNQGAVQLRR